ncbi:MAG: 2-oxo-4-hydroxy-4-carboxy-5-ureidoimidazoline decarboxylase [Caulobacter sp.]|nr:2-oxo-4-hydroxy-4-carboxy-5-ureidoimidazoline decarboxylase [Vitreoscilla sp.]
MNASLAQLDAAAADDAVALLDGIYEHSPGIAAAAMVERPFGDLVHLKRALVDATRAGGRGAQLALLRAHPKLAGKAMVAGALTAESTDEQTRSGLTQCSPEEFARLHALNDAYDARFGWPFILAVRGPTGLGLARLEIIATFERRLSNEPEAEFEECLRNVHRIAELRLADRF